VYSVAERGVSGQCTAVVWSSCWRHSSDHRWSVPQRVHCHSHLHRPIQTLPGYQQVNNIPNYILQWHLTLRLDAYSMSNKTLTKELFSQQLVLTKEPSYVLQPLLLVATSLSPPLSRTLAPVHLLWRVLRPGINCRCTYEHGSQSVPSRRH